MEEKIRVKRVFLCKVEGRGRESYSRHRLETDGKPIEDDGKPIELDCKQYEEAPSFALTNKVLVDWAMFVQKNSYDKTDFVVAFADGKAYRGRYDLKHFSEEVPDLRRHVRAVANYMKSRPSADPSWKELVDRYDV